MRLLSALALFSLTACTAMTPAPQFATANGADEHFEGVADLLSPSRPVDVIFVHGMCTHDEKWPGATFKALYESMGGSGDIAMEPAVSVAGTGVELYQKTLTVPGGTLRANAIRWSQLTAPLKGRLCYDQTDKSPTCPAAEASKTYPYPRAALNRLLKDTILDDCLSDALIYQGTARDEISGQIQKAIVQASATSGGERRSDDMLAASASVPADIPLVFITDSLGSKVTFDAVWKLTTGRATAAAGQRTFDRTSQIFMRANQLPILALADKHLDGTSALRADSIGASAGEYPQDPIAALMRDQRARGRSFAEPRHQLLQVVAFTDPNDLLSFILAPSPHSQAAGYPVVDVVLSNDKTYLWTAELPTTAHLGYAMNPKVQRLIRCGHRVDGGCVQR
jgi:hypothetical protein